MKKNKFDFSGWATKNDLLCADGRTIRKDAFKDDDGRTVPLVYQHNHDDPTRVIGHALLENREDGVYAYCSLNNTDMGRHARECVRHGDFDSLSIYANKLVQRGGDVIHGVIRELSLVLAGANPGAKIEFPMLSHGEESDSEATIWHDDDDGFVFEEGMRLSHADDEEEEEKKPAKEEPKPAKEEEPVKKEEAKPEKDEKSEKDETVQDVLDSMSDKQRKVVEYLVAQALGGEGEDEEEEDKEEEEEVKHADSDDDETIQDVLDSMTDKQRKVTEYLVAQALDSAESEEDEADDDEEAEDKEAAHSDIEGEDYTMKKNVFDNEAMEQKNDTLTHAQMETLIKDAKRIGSLRQSVLEHSAEYGIDQIDWLFPEDRNVNNTPTFIQRDMGWVTQVMGAVSHTPFSRIKTLFADITEEQARARGYIKGKQKKNEVFTLLKRTTDPQTIYKKQKLNRDDVVDITDFDVVAWMKQEMRTMLDEEIARAILIGDGRETDDDDHISEDHIHSVFQDDDTLFVVRKQYEAVQGEEKAKTLIKLVRKAWKDYKGSGNAVAYVSEDTLSDLLLLEDSFGHFLYPTKDVAASVLGVQSIVTVPPMADVSTVRVDEDAEKTYRPLMIIVNLKDYNVGADKGGSVNMFEDFDIDYNAQKYLIETRCSGALVRPFSAIVIEEEVEEEEEEQQGGGT